MMTDETRWLVVFDTDRIKDYILSTPDLGKIRGASILLEFLNRASSSDIGSVPLADSTRTLLARHAGSEELVVTAGGMAAAVLPASADPNRVVAEVERLYVMNTKIASVTGIPIRTTQPELDGILDGAFERLMAKATMKLREAKDQRAPAGEITLMPYLRPCDACRRYPASKVLPTEEGEELICEACRIKEERGKPGRSIFWNEFLKAAGEAWRNAKFPKDFGEIGETSTPQGYLGFIYADGNGIGNLIGEIPSFPEFKTFSNRLDALVRQVTYDALNLVLKEPRLGEQRRAPFEILLVGGDDLMLVVAADAALKVALHLTDVFETQSQAELKFPASLSTAVVIAHDSFPLKSLHELGSELLRSAKRASSDDNRGRIDFMVVTEAGSAGVEAVRKRVLTRQSPLSDEEIILSRRPYTVEDLKQLLACARKVKDEIPRHQLQALYESLFQLRHQAQLVGLRVRRKRRHRDTWDQLAENLGISIDIFPWRRMVVNGKWRLDTPLVDLVEIYDFI